MMEQNTNYNIGQAEKDLPKCGVEKFVGRQSKCKERRVAIGCSMIRTAFFVSKTHNSDKVSHSTRL